MFPRCSLQTASETAKLPEHSNGRQDLPQGIMTARLLWTRRRFLVRSSVAGLVLGTLLAFLIPKQYQSSTQLMPPDTTMGGPLATLTSVASMSSVAEQAADMLPMKSTGALFIGILRSRTVKDRLVERFQLEKVYRVRLMVDARRILEESTEITEDRRAGIITVTVTDRDPKRAAAMAHAYVEELDHLVTKLNTSAAHRERVFIEGQLMQVKHDLDEASRQLSDFSSKNATVDVKEQAKAMVDAAATLEGQIIAAEAELKGLQQIYTSNNVRVREVQARIKELRAHLQEMGGGVPQAAEADPAQPELASYPSIRKLPLLGLTYADLYRRATIQDVLYQALTKQYELAKVQEAKEIPSVRVLDAAEVPEKKSYPHRLVIMLVSAFLACALAAAWVTGNSFWNRADPQDPTKLLVQEILATVPYPGFLRRNGFDQPLAKTQAEKPAPPASLEVPEETQARADG